MSPNSASLRSLPPGRPFSAYYDILVVVLGALLLILVTVWRPPSPIEPRLAVIIVAFVIILASFPLTLLRSEITLIQAQTIGVSLLFGPSVTAWLITLGILVGYGIRQVWSLIRHQRPFSKEPLALEIGVAVGRQIVPLVLAFSVFNLKEFTALIPLTAFLGQAVGLAVLFALVHSALYLIDFILRQSPGTPTQLRDLISLTLVELLPLPFVLLAVLIFPENLIGTLITLGGIPSLLAVLMYEIGVARADLERRLQDLSTLNSISRTMGSTLDMDDLLPVIQHQVTRLLGVDNFYVALYDMNDRKIWYPLAVKHGERKAWPRRPLADRLTDRVIREQRPILLAREAQQELARIGLPPSEDAPYAWLGVPLIASDQSIGCLAVFSTSPQVEFESADLNLLITLSGQVSAAVENALLYDQAQGRAAQLETLNRITSLITASLDPKNVLAQVCSSVTEVGGGQRSAIFLTEPLEGRVRLAYAHGLSEAFVTQNQSFPMGLDIRTRCLRTGRPALTSDLGKLSRDYEFLQAFEEENIRAFGDFPLITPEGQIGFLSVYFNNPHDFRPQQVELLQTFASQAALAVSNARLYARTDMALTRRAHQLEILENIGRELAAAIQSDRLFDMILDHALEFTHSPWGSLNLYDPKTRTLEIKAARGYDLEKRQFPESNDLMGRVIRKRKAITIGDLTKEAKHIDHTGGAAKSLISAPLVHEDRVLGVLTVESPNINAFGSTDQSFINQLATQAAIAVVNAELYSETRRQLHEQAVLNKVSQRLVGNLNLNSVLNHVVEAIATNLETEISCIYLWDANQKVYTLRAGAEAGPVSAHGLPAELALEDVESIVQKTSSETEGRLVQVAACERCQSIIQPLTIGDQRLGIVVSHLPRQRVVRARDLQLPRSIATQGAFAVQNALLFSDVTQGRDRLEAVLNSVDDGVLMVDGQGYVILRNAAIGTITGTSFDKLLGKRLPELPADALSALGFTPHQAQALVQKLGQAQRAPAPKVTIKNGGEKIDKVLERFTAPVWGQGRNVIGWVFVVRDVSEEYRLSEARELITETLVHDLRSPVGAVTSALKMIDEVLPPEERDHVTRQSLDIANRSTRRVMNLIESLLEVSRMETGNIVIDLAPLDLRSLTAGLIAELMPQATGHGILLQNEISESTPAVHADREMIARVLSNLLDNALKFTPEGGQVSISAETLDGQFVAMSVSDTGPGIAEEFREKIFDRFSQIPGLRGRHRGSGIGLTFCRLAVEAHGGKIWVEPRADSGSSFTFTLPIFLEIVEEPSVGKGSGGKS